MNHTIISIKDVSIYQGNVLILSNVQFNLSVGEFAYLIGKTGSGKSSLLKTLYAELPAKEGELEVAGYDMRKIKQKSIPYLRRKIGIVFQDFKLLHDRTVNDNLLFVMKATGWKNKLEMNERVQEVLNQVDLSSKGHKMPHQLSGGEQQRVAIARALINKPELILADEPTGNLDPQTSNGIMNLLLEINKNGTAMFLATHNYALIERFPARVVLCQDGKLFAEN